MPSARQAPRTKVVLPLPSSPETVTTSPTCRLRASGAVARGASRRLAREQLGGKVRGGGSALRWDQRALPEQKTLAGLDLVGLGIAISRRAAHEHICDIDLLAPDPDSRQQLVEQFAG